MGTKLNPCMQSWNDIEFQDWTKRFDSLLKGRTPARRGLEKLIECNSSAFQDPRYTATPDRRISRLLLIYSMTSIIEMPSSVIKSEESSRKRLERITADMERYVAYLQKVGTCILSNDGLLPLEVTPVLRAIESAAKVSSSFLTCLQRPYARFGNRVDFNLPFLQLLKNNRVPEKEAYGLTQIAMKAHGYRPHEISLLDATFIPTGTIRKSRKAYGENMQESMQVHERYRSKTEEEKRRILYSK